MKNKIIGKKVILRRLKKGDEFSIYQNVRDKDIYRFMPPIPCPYTIKDARKFIRSGSKKGYQFGVVLKDKNEVIGTMALVPGKINKKIAEAGYWLGKKYRRQGIGFEALELILNFGFKDLKLKRIFAKVIKGNFASAGLLEKHNFKLEGILRSHCFCRGKLQDDLFYGLLKDEFLK
jgi:RimJ/RimL family protein N-acetyltransferase